MEPALPRLDASLLPMLSREAWVMKWPGCWYWGFALWRRYVVVLGELGWIVLETVAGPLDECVAPDPLWRTAAKPKYSRLCPTFWHSAVAHTPASFGL